jgi:hypothetical protein
MGVVVWQWHTLSRGDEATAPVQLTFGFGHRGVGFGRRALLISVYSHPGSPERLLQAARLSIPKHLGCTGLPVRQNW